PSGLAAKSESPPPGQASRPYIGTCCTFVHVLPLSVDLNSAVSCSSEAGSLRTTAFTKPVGPASHSAPSGERRREGSSASRVASTKAVEKAKAGGGGGGGTTGAGSGVGSCEQPARRDRTKTAASPRRSRRMAARRPSPDFWLVGAGHGA